MSALIHPFSFLLHSFFPSALLSTTLQEHRRNIKTRPIDSQTHRSTPFFQPQPQVYFRVLDPSSTNQPHTNQPARPTSQPANQANQQVNQPANQPCLRRRLALTLFHKNSLQPRLSSIHLFFVFSFFLFFLSSLSHKTSTLHNTHPRLAWTLSASVEPTNNTCTNKYHQQGRISPPTHPSLLKQLNTAQHATTTNNSKKQQPLLLND